MALAGRALQRRDAHVYYLGRAAGLMGLIDSSEMVDTYGCRLDEVRAFISGGWTFCGAAEGDISSRSPLLRISLQDFASRELLALGPQDVVILLSYNDFPTEDLQVLEAVARSPAQVAAITVGSLREAQLSALSLQHHLVCVMEQPCFPATHVPCYADFALKLMLNCLTTGANVVRGAVYGNTMINLTVSNNKLFQRSVEIVSKITGCSEAVARDSIMNAIFQGRPPATDAMALSRVIEIATPMHFIVPTACLLATGKYSSDTARVALQGSARLRDLIRAAVMGQARA